MSEKTTYTKIWEANDIELLYKRFSAVVKPFELPLLDVIIQKTNEIFKDKNNISMFEIGAGSGQHTQIILDGLPENKIINYTGIDVSEKQRDGFIARSKELGDNVKIVSYEISSWQDYVVTKKYDMVIAQHSWYGIGGDISNFHKIKEILTEDGVCFVLLNPRSNLSQIAIEDNREKAYCSEDFELGVNSVGLKFERLRSYNDDNTRESFYKDRRLTQHGLDHFSYLYRKDLKGDEQNVIDMLVAAPDESFRFPTDLLIITN